MALDCMKDAFKGAVTEWQKASLPAISFSQLLVLKNGDIDMVEDCIAQLFHMQDETSKKSCHASEQAQAHTRS